MRSRLLASVSCFLVLFCVCGGASAASSPNVDIPYEKHVLPNGLTLILHEDHKTPIVAVNVWYHVGSKDERPGRTGFAHLFEHLMFNGSENFNDDFFKPLRPAGATTMNGTTWLDRTNYFQNVPTSALDLTLWLESDRMGHMLGAVDQARLDEQRGVVQNEKRQGENRPYGRVYEVIAANIYPAGHPYSWATIGSMEDLNAATLEDVREWFQKWYGAANAVLVVAGDIDPAEVKRKVEHYFGDIPGGPALTRAKSWIAKLDGDKRATMQDRVPQARIYKVWNVPGYTSNEVPLLAAASFALGGSENSRLYKRLVYDDQIATDVSAEIAPFEIGSQVWIAATAKPGGDLAQVERALDEELARFLKEGPTADELERFKSFQHASLARKLERVGGDGKSALLAESEVYGGTPDFYKRRFELTLAATRTDVHNAAKEWLSGGSFALEVHPVADFVTARSGADRSKLPALGSPPPLKLPELQRATLSNGLEIAVAERPDAPVVHVQLLVDAGVAADSLAKPGTATLAAAMMTQGTKTMNALEIAARAERLGAALNAASGLDMTTLSLSALAPKLPESLDLFADVLLNPTFPQDELKRQQSQLVAAIKQQKSQPNGIATRLLPQLVFGDGHPYALPTLGEEASVEAMTRDELVTFYRHWVRPDNATLLIVGGTTLEQIKPLLERRLAAWKNPATALPAKGIPSVTHATKTRVVLVDQPGAPQSVISLGYPAPTRMDPAYPIYQTANAILGDGFLSRINMNLREDKHWSYGARSALRADARGPGFFQVSAPVQSDKTSEAIQEIVKELRDFSSSRPPTQEETQIAKDSIALALPGSVETAAGLAGFYQSLLVNRLPNTYWNDFVANVGSVTQSQLQGVASALARVDGATWVIVGDLARIEDSVRKLNLGEVVVMDANGRVVR